MLQKHESFSEGSFHSVLFDYFNPSQKKKNEENNSKLVTPGWFYPYTETKQTTVRKLQTNTFHEFQYENPQQRASKLNLVLYLKKKKKKPIYTVNLTDLPRNVRLGQHKTVNQLNTLY